MISQELLEALNKTLGETDLDQIAVWALLKYLQGIWKDTPDKNIRPFDLGKAMSDFYVDLSQHRLPDKITSQTPETEPALLEFFGAAAGSLTQFWTRSLEIWNVTLEPNPAFAREVQKYFDLLLRSSRQGNRLGSPAALPELPKEPPAPAPGEGHKKPQKAHSPAPAGAEVAEAQPAATPASPAPTMAEPIPEPPAPVAAQAPSIPEPAEEASGKPVAPPASPKKSALPVTSELNKKLAPAQGPAPADTDKTPESPASASPSKDEPESKTIPRNAYLVLQGTRVIPLNRTFIKIGRQLDNHIILEDPRVSRAHAQIKLIKDRFVIFDMNSTGGTFVNGQPTSQSVLYAGDIVSLAGVVFIYSQELPAKPGEVKIIELGSPFAADRPTAVMHREQIKPAKKTGDKGLPELPKTGPLG